MSDGEPQAGSAQSDVNGTTNERGLPPDVAAIMTQHPKTRRLFDGLVRGSGPDGQRLGTSASYDFALIVALIKYGVHDVPTLDATLRLRPDSHAAKQGDAYIAEVIARAQELLFPRGPSGASPTGTVTIPFNLEKVRRFDGDPRVYALTIDGVELRLTSLQLGDREAFKQKYFDRLNKFPQLPSGRGAPAEWDAIVQQIADLAEDILVPIDGTREGALTGAIRRAIDDLPLGDGAEELGRRGLLVSKRALVFTTDAIVAALSLHDAKPEREEIARLLPQLGCAAEERTFKHEGTRSKKMTVWRTKPTPRQLAAIDPTPQKEAAASTPDFTKPAVPTNNARSEPTDDEGSIH